jgi:hypothetical protein
LAPSSIPAHLCSVYFITVPYGGGKAMMDVLGCPCGGYRKPLKAFTRENLQDLRAALEAEALWAILRTHDLAATARP